MRRLFAIDLDGTLLNPEGRIDPRDEAAIARARSSGILVTLATGRLFKGALGIARSLGIEAPLICADGGLLSSARTGARLAERAIEPDAIDPLLALLSAHELEPMLFFSDAIHTSAKGARYKGYLTQWTPDFVQHPELRETAAWRRDSAVLLLLGIGGRDAVHAARTAIERRSSFRLTLADFPLGQDNSFALRLQPEGCTKGEALAKLAESARIPREGIAAIGDWYNDIPMFEKAHRSFAMGHAPPKVRAAATDTLVATAATGGGVAEALRRWLED